MEDLIARVLTDPELGDLREMAQVTARRVFHSNSQTILGKECSPNVSEIIQSFRLELTKKGIPFPPLDDKTFYNLIVREIANLQIRMAP